jgi:hypothetical protein
MVKIDITNIYNYNIYDYIYKSIKWEDTHFLVQE